MQPPRLQDDTFETPIFKFTQKFLRFLIAKSKLRIFSTKEFERTTMHSAHSPRFQSRSWKEDGVERGRGGKDRRVEKDEHNEKSCSRSSRGVNGRERKKESVVGKRGEKTRRKQDGQAASPGSLKERSTVVHGLDERASRA